MSLPIFTGPLNKILPEGGDQDNGIPGIALSVLDTQAAQKMDMESGDEAGYSSRWSASSDEEECDAEEAEFSDNESDESDASSEAEIVIKDIPGFTTNDSISESQTNPDFQREVHPIGGGSESRNPVEDQCTIDAVDKRRIEPLKAVYYAGDDTILPNAVLDSKLHQYGRGRREGGAPKLPSLLNPEYVHRRTLALPPPSESDHDELLALSRTLCSIDLGESPESHAYPKSESSWLDHLQTGGDWSDEDGDAAFAAAVAKNTVAGSELVLATANNVTGMTQEQQNAAATEVLEKQRSHLIFELETENLNRQRRGLGPREAIKFVFETLARRAEVSRALCHDYRVKYEESGAQCQWMQKQLAEATAVAQRSTKNVEALQTCCEDALDAKNALEVQIVELLEKQEEQTAELDEVKRKLHQAKEANAKLKDAFIKERERCRMLQEHADTLEPRKDLVHVGMAHVGPVYVQSDQLTLLDEVTQIIERSKDLERSNDQYEKLDETKALHDDLCEHIDRLKSRNKELETEVETLRMERFKATDSLPPTASTNPEDWPQVYRYQSAGSVQCGAESSIAIQKSDAPDLRPLPSRPVSRETKRSHRAFEDGYNATPPPLPAASTDPIKLGFAPQRKRGFALPEPLVWQKRQNRWRKSRSWTEHREKLSKLRQQEDEAQADYELLKQRAFQKQFGYSLAAGSSSTKQERIRFFEDVLSRPERLIVPAMPVLMSH